VAICLPEEVLRSVPLLSLVNGNFVASRPPNTEVYLSRCISTIDDFITLAAHGHCLMLLFHHQQQRLSLSALAVEKHQYPSCVPAHVLLLADLLKGARRPECNSKQTGPTLEAQAVLASWFESHTCKHPTSQNRNQASTTRGAKDPAQQDGQQHRQQWTRHMDSICIPRHESSARVAPMKDMSTNKTSGKALLPCDRGHEQHLLGQSLMPSHDFHHGRLVAPTCRILLDAGTCSSYHERVQRILVVSLI